MVAIIGLLLCVYLVFKGVEIFQLSLVNPNPQRRLSGVIGVVSLVASVVLAGGFGAWIFLQSWSMEQRQTDLQRQMELLNR